MPAYVCNYTNEELIYEHDGWRYTFWPGPNVVWDDDSLTAIRVDLQNQFENGTLDIVDTLKAVQWHRVAEPWRSAYFRAYGDALLGDQRREELRQKEAMLGDSIRRMNEARLRAAGLLSHLRKEVQTVAHNAPRRKKR